MPKYIIEYHISIKYEDSDCDIENTDTYEFETDEKDVEQAFYDYYENACEDEFIGLDEDTDSEITDSIMEVISVKKVD